MQVRGMAITVILGLVPRTHAVLNVRTDVGPRDKPEGDGFDVCR